jgi:hypothetical protein
MAGGGYTLPKHRKTSNDSSTMKITAKDLFTFTTTSSYVRTGDLEIGKSYKIVDMQRIDTQYGSKLV